MPSEKVPHANLKNAEQKFSQLEICSRHTETPREALQDILEAAEKAYAAVGVTYYNNRCIDVVNEMGMYLLNTLNKGYRAMPLRASYMFIDHMYISIYPPNSERRIIADTTWQQFLAPKER